MTPGPSPPRLAQALLARCLPRGAVRDSVLGDLYEMHAARAADPAVGPRRATFWYWSHALRIAAGYMLRRARRRTAENPNAPRSELAASTMKWTTTRGGGGMGDFVRDVRIALRSFRRAPGFVLVALLTLALGVGANTAVFSVVNGIYLRPLDFRDPDRLVEIGQSAQDGSYQMATQTGGTWSDWARDQRSFEDFAGYRYWTTTLERDGVASRITAVHSLGSIFDVLGVRPLLGRTFTAAEEGPGRENLAVLSHAFWRQEYGEEDPVGRTLLLDGVPHEIIGVMPASFQFPVAGVDLWKTADLTVAALQDPDDHFINTVARLAPGRTLAQASDEMEGVHAGMRQADPEHLAGSTAEVMPLRGFLLGGVGTLWLTLMASVGFVLLIASVNLANLLLSRASTRAGEVALRRALGASRGRVTRQVVTESAVLGTLGGLAGLGVGWLFLRGILAWMPGGVPRAQTMHIDGTVLAFTLAVSVLAGILSGVLPALRIPDAALGSRLRTRRGGDGHRLRRGLVVAEVALAVVLVTGAGLALRGFAAVSRLDPGFDPQGRSVFHVALQGDATDAARAAFYRELVSQTAAISGVQGAGVTSVYPMSGFTPGSYVGRPGQVVGAESDAPVVRYVGVSPRFRATAGIALLRGRDLTDDDGPNGTPALLLSRSAAELLFPDGDALGADVYLGPDGVVAPVSTVVGIVDDVRQRGMAQPAPPMAYVPRDDIAFWRGFDVVIDAPGAAGPALADQVRTLAAGLNPQAVVLRPTDARTFVAGALVGQRNTMLLFGLMGLVALALAVVGVAGVVAFLVGQRTREMGVRMAVGASRMEVQGLVLRQTLVPVVAGALLGAVAALWLGRFMESLVVGVDPTDPLTLVLVPLLLVFAASLASWVPARRAARVDPVRALSGE